MDELKFVIKSFLATLLLVAIMQIKIGERTIESKTYQMLAQSQLTSFLNDVARKSVYLAQEAKKQVEQGIKKFNSP